MFLKKVALPAFSTVESLAKLLHGIAALASILFGQVSCG